MVYIIVSCSPSLKFTERMMCYPYLLLGKVFL